MREDIDRMPSEARDCLRSALGEKTMNKIQSGELTPGPQLGDAIQGCFQKMPPSMEGEPGQEQERQEHEGRPGIPPPEGSEFRRSPGGCSTPEECQSFCSQNPEACQNFQRSEDKQRSNEQRPIQNQFPPPGEREEPREWERREPQDKQIPPEFQRPEMPMPSDEMTPPPGFVPPSEFEGRMPIEQSQPLEPVPQMQQQFQEPQREMLPPPPPPSEPAPQSLLNNKYLGAIFRFLLNN